MQTTCVEQNAIVKLGVTSHPLSPQVVVAPIQPRLAMTKARLLQRQPPTTTFKTKVKGKQAGCSCEGCFLKLAPEQRLIPV